VKKYWGEFAPAAFVFINACESANDVADPFTAALRNKGAMVIAGWYNCPRIGDADLTARFVFDRLLGANVYDHEAYFAQRAFDYHSVMTDMPLHGWGTSNLAQLTFTPVKPGATDFALLAPSIERVAVNELTGQLLVYGLFGKDPGFANRSVIVDGQDLVCPEPWESYQIVCTIPSFGSGSAGDVIVTVRGIKSNVARLTKWSGTFHYQVTGPDSLVQTVDFNIDLRADVRTYRTAIHCAPVEPQSDMWVTNTSSANYSCAGSSTQGTNPVDTYTWVGNGHLVTPPIMGTGGFQGEWSLADSHDLQMLLDPELSPQACNTNDHSKYQDPVTGQITETDTPGTLNLCGYETYSDMMIGIDQNANLNAGTATKGVTCSFVLPSWQSTIKWGQIQPEFPPDPKSAR
jgi:hypothetical protein